jgi:hypothetical protein
MTLDELIKKTLKKKKAKSPMGPYPDELDTLIQDFTAMDMLRRTGAVGPDAAIQDRMREGRLMSGLMGRFAPVGTVPVALAGAGYEGAKWLGQQTGLGQYFPGPFQTNETTSPASIDNVIALLAGFTE